MHVLHIRSKRARRLLEDACVGDPRAAHLHLDDSARRVHRHAERRERVQGDDREREHENDGGR